MNVSNTKQPRVVATVPVGARPVGVAVDVHDRVFVTNSGAGTVSVIDSRTNTVSTTLTVGPHPEGVATDPQFGVYVANSGANTVSMINKSNVLVATVRIDVPLAPSPRMKGVAVDHFLSRAYVANRGSHRVWIIRISGALPPFAHEFVEVPDPLDVAVDPTSHRVYVTQPGFNTVSVVDPATDRVIATVPVGPRPTGIAVDAPRHRVHVADSGSTAVSVIDTATGGVTDTDVAAGPVDVAVDSRGDAYVTRSDGTVAVIGAASHGVSAAVPVGSRPEGLAFEPHSGRVYVANSGDGTVSAIAPTGG
ncbi:YncE family protein [Streptomyces sp. TRM76323]|uniref:YncE family protein n=1 Tax=Streptomyces tamarix TaxID=3078565 RepID=A0ABU3QGC7_9ACTN|nr:YncE family protein [Streptomyces tamarix]MDT9681731.1 YncE family protein [Streptomyces tamarix]